MQNLKKKKWCGYRHTPTGNVFKIDQKVIGVDLKRLRRQTFLNAPEHTKEHICCQYIYIKTEVSWIWANQKLPVTFPVLVID